MAVLVIYDRSTSTNIEIPETLTCTDFRTRPVTRTHLSNNMQIHSCTQIGKHKRKSDPLKVRPPVAASTVRSKRTQNERLGPKTKHMRPCKRPHASAPKRPPTQVTLRCDGAAATAAVAALSMAAVIPWP